MKKMDKTKKLILLGLVVVVVLIVVWFAFIAPNMYSTNPVIRGPSDAAGKTSTTTITLPNGTVVQIAGTSGFPAGGSSASERPPTPPE